METEMLPDFSSSDNIDVNERSVNTVMKYVDSDALIIGIEQAGWTSRKRCIVREVLLGLVRARNEHNT